MAHRTNGNFEELGSTCTLHSPLAPVITVPSSLSAVATFHPRAYPSSSIKLNLNGKLLTWRTKYMMSR